MSMTMTNTHTDTKTKTKTLSKQTRGYLVETAAKPSTHTSTATLATLRLTLRGAGMPFF